nr:AarF/UbiB family protein [Acanthopleuribacter pedis]
MGQAVSTRSDLLPIDILDELAKLQDRVAPFDGERAQAILELELGEQSGEIASFDHKPLAAGSIGQVHLATLKSGVQVAVKIRRPRIAQIIEVDVQIMHNMATLMEKHMELGQIHRPTKIVEEFARTLDHELDYEFEAANLKRFARQFEDNPIVHVPRVYDDLSNHRVLVLEFINGTKPTRREELESLKMDPKEIAQRGAKLIIEQIFVHGFFHADPHPGNIMVLPNHVICYLDFGMMGRLDRLSRERFADLFLAVVQADSVKAAEVLLKLTQSHKLVDRLSLEREIDELIDQHLFRSLKDLEVGPLLRAILDVTVKYRLSIPAPYFLLLKAITQMEDLGGKLDPEFSFSEEAGPYIRRIMVNRYHPRRLAGNLWETSQDIIYLAKEVPGEMRELLKQLKQGKAKMELEHLGLTPLMVTLDRISNRIASAIVLASLIIGSSLIVHAKVPPLWHEIPIIGLAGYVVSAVMGFSMLRAIMKKRG